MIKQLKLIIAVMFVGCIFTANAQKLPNVQNVSVRAPQNVKIDGKLNEWDDSFKAHNSATDISYIMSNDDENLYLTVKAADNTTLNRIVGKGLTLNIYRSGKKNAKDVASFTYPVTEKGSGLIFTFHPKRLVPDTTAAALAAKIANANKSIEQKAKNIRVLGVEGVDSLVSVYNDLGIKMRGVVDSKEALDMEFAIPLKYLKLSTAEGNKFAYQIVVNGIMNMMGMITFTPAEGSTPEQAARLEASMQQMNNRMAQQSAPTDFWGEYTLAKK